MNLIITKPLKSNFSLQEYLTLGYIYLLVLGILGDSIYYRFFGINILSYSSVTDVLLSPIVIVADQPIILLGPALGVGALYYLRAKWSPKIHQKYREKRWYRRLNNVERLDQRYATPVSTNTLVGWAAMLTLCLLLGFDVGKGAAISGKVRRGKAAVDHTLVFRGQEPQRVTLIGQNSLYLFYTGQGEKTVTIAPIENNVETIQKIALARD